MENNWYILNVVAGQEQKIADKIKTLIFTDLKNTVEDAIVPAKQVLKVKKGKKVQDSQKLFPGYVFVKTNLSGDSSIILTSIPKVAGFLGSKNNPKAVSKAKMENIFSIINNDKIDASNEASFEIGENLNIIDGPFESFSGTVEEFDAEKQRVKISVLIFGRATSVDLDITQVEKISD